MVLYEARKKLLLITSMQLPDGRRFFLDIDSTDESVEPILTVGEVKKVIEKKIPDLFLHPDEPSKDSKEKIRKKIKFPNGNIRIDVGFHEG
jgi:hypothetical protein